MASSQLFPFGRVDRSSSAAVPTAGTGSTGTCRSIYRTLARLGYYSSYIHIHVHVDLDLDLRTGTLVPVERRLDHLCEPGD